MTIVRPTHYTANPDEWRKFLTTLGFTQAFAGDDPWTVYDANGRLAVHGVLEGDPLHGKTDLDLLVDDIAPVRDALVAAGYPVEEAATQEDGPADLLFTEVGGVQLTLAAPAGTSSGALTVQPIWYTDDFTAPEALLLALGFVPRAESRSENWVEFAADGGGLVALHRGTTPQVELSLRADGVSLDELEQVLRAAGYAARTSETPDEGIATLHVTTPDGWELWINAPLP